MSIAQQISRLESLIKQHDPVAFEKLPGPANAVDIEALKKRYGQAIPPDYITFLLTHDGVSSNFLLENILSAKDVISEADVNDELEEDGDFDDFEAEAGLGVKSVWWSKKWIPISANGAGDSYCIDTAPASGGKRGQIVSFWHDDGSRDVVAPNFTEWLKIRLDQAEQFRKEDNKPAPPPKKKSWWSW